MDPSISRNIYGDLIQPDVVKTWRYPCSFSSSSIGSDSDPAAAVDGSWRLGFERDLDHLLGNSCLRNPDGLKNNGLEWPFPFSVNLEPLLNQSPCFKVWGGLMKNGHHMHVLY